MRRKRSPSQTAFGMTNSTDFGLQVRNVLPDDFAVVIVGGGVLGGRGRPGQACGAGSTSAGGARDGRPSAFGHGSDSKGVPGAARGVVGDGGGNEAGPAFAHGSDNNGVPGAARGSSWATAAWETGRAFSTGRGSSWAATEEASPQT